MTSRLSNNRSVQEISESGKAVYVSPHLLEYGKLSDITLSVNSSLTGDNVNKSNNKTV